MEKQKINLRNELLSHKYEFNLLQKIPCSKQENQEYQRLLKENQALPEGVLAYVYDTGEVSTTEFYTIYKPDLTESEIREYLTYKQLSFIKTIKNCVLFFTVSAIIGIVAYLLSILNTL